MKCKYIENCPSRSGWCLTRKPDTKCIPHIQMAISSLKEELKQAETILEKIKRADCANLPVW